MKIIKPLLISSVILLSPITLASDKVKEGETLFKSHCASCHGLATGGMDMSKRIAPPIAGVRKHYVDVYPDETSFIKAITDWVEKQDVSKSLMPGAINKFKIMPPLVVSKEDTQKIAAFIYSGDIERPQGLHAHMDEMHKKMGMKDEHEGHEGHEGHEAKAVLAETHEETADEQMQKMQRMQKMQMAEDNNNFNRMSQMMMGYNPLHHNGMGGKQCKKQKMWGGKGMNRMQGMMRQLNLSPQQKQKMQGFIQAKKAVMQPLKQELRQIKRTIHQLDTTSPKYKSQIFSLADKKSKLVFRMVVEKGEKRMQIESILNPQQRAKFKAIRQQRFMQKKNH